MFNKTLLAAALVFSLSACGPDEFDRAAQRDSQRAYQSQYSSMAECQHHFAVPNDCYRGTNGFFFSPMYYPWGAIMHRNNTITYNNSVPVSGGRWVNNPTATRVNFTQAQSFVSSRANSSRVSFSSSSASRGGFGSSASRASGGFGSAGG